jgi:hypothetical protein
MQKNEKSESKQQNQHRSLVGKYTGKWGSSFWTYRLTGIVYGTAAIEFKGYNQVVIEIKYEGFYRQGQTLRIDTIYSWNKTMDEWKTPLHILSKTRKSSISFCGKTSDHDLTIEGTYSAKSPDDEGTLTLHKVKVIQKTLKV